MSLHQAIFNFGPQTIVLLDNILSDLGTIYFLLCEGLRIYKEDLISKKT